ncbi:MAG: hypothetical protein AB7T63_10725 [Planctomycetota bacterium]
MSVARSLLALVLLPAALALSSCGLVESIAEDFVDDQDVTLFAASGLSGSVVRTTGGTDVSAQPDVLAAGDLVAGTQVLGVIAIRIDGTQQPDKTSLDSIRLRFWVEVSSGDPAPLGPLVVSHLPDHPDLPLAVGQVPHPPGNDIATITDVTTSGWREVNVTSAFLSDWNSDDTVSAFAVRLATPTDGDATADVIALQGDDDGSGNPAVPHVILHFGVDL